MPTGLLKDIGQACPEDAQFLGLDVGVKTIGLALGSRALGIATPLETIKRTKFSKDMQALYKIAQKHEVNAYIIGLPVNMDGSEGRRAQSVRDFVAEMQRYLLSVSSRTAQPEGSYAADSIFIALWDERLSTVSVEGVVDSFVEKRKTKINAKSSGLIDKLAAQTILQGALDYLSENIDDKAF